VTRHPRHRRRDRGDAGAGRREGRGGYSKGTESAAKFKEKLEKEGATVSVHQGRVDSPGRLANASVHEVLEGIRARVDYLVNTQALRGQNGVAGCPTRIGRRS